MARLNLAHKCQRCLRPSALGDVCLRDARFTATTRARAELTQVQPRHTTGWCPYWGRCSARTRRAHTTRSHGRPTARRCEDLQTTSGIKPGAGAWSLASATRHKTGHSHTLRTQTRLCVLLRSVLKLTAYRQQYADNQNMSFLPAIVSTSCRMHGEFLRLLFLQAPRETEARFT
jgi:hypothetical protein